MHWIKATTPQDGECWINLAAIPTMFRAADATILFLGGVSHKPDGQVQYATTAVKETPEQLLAMPRWEKPAEVPAPAVLAEAKAKRRRA